MWFGTITLGAKEVAAGISPLLLWGGFIVGFIFNNMTGMMKKRDELIRHALIFIPAVQLG